MDQPDLFRSDNQPPPPRRTRHLITDTPRAREVDPATSHEAAAKIKTSGHLAAQQRQALELVRLWPGSTCWELALHVARGTGTTQESQERWLSRRLGELVGVGVRKGEPRVVKGRSATTWWPQ